MNTAGLERALYDALRTQAVLEPIVGDRVFVGRVPQLGEMPAIVLRRLSVIAEYDLDNEITERQVVYEVASVARGDSGATVSKQMDDAVNDLLSGFVGALGTAPDTVDVQGCTVESGNYLYEPPANATDEGTHNYSTDFRITYTQPTPTH